MKKSGFYFLIGCLTVLLSASCSSSGTDTPLDTPNNPPVVKPMPISLSFNVDAQTRVNDTGYELNDRIGLYAVNYVGDTPGELTTTGNHVDNMRFTYDGAWTPQSPIYWKDNTTPVDFYAYHPYGQPQDITAHTFSVKANQSTLSELKASDFLWGKATRIMPTEKAVKLQTSHLFSTIQIKVAAGNGFTAESLKAAQVSVTLQGCKLDAQINLKDGSVQATGTPTSIQPYLDQEVYKALVVPQTVTADDFITVRVDNRDFKLKKSFTFVGGKRHTFTVTVSKTNNGINVGVNPWEDDHTDHGGTAE